jgi:hypothetical protein
MFAWSGSTGAAPTPPTDDVASLPSGVSYSTTADGGYVFNQAQTSPPASYLLNAASTQGSNACYYGGTFTVKLTWSAGHSFNGTISVYIVDGDSSGRGETITDGTTLHTLSSMDSGIWVQWTETVASGGSLTFTVNNTAGPNAVIGGVFFDLAGGHTASDTSNSSDSSSRVLHVARTGSDTSNSSDSASRTEPKSRTGSDTSGSSDSGQRASLTFTRHASDTSSSSDSGRRLISIGRFGSDTSSSAGSAARGSILFGRTGTDSSGSTDSASGRRVEARSGIDMSLSSDSTTRQPVSFARSGSDSSASSDSASSGHAAFLTASDTSLSTDSTARGALVFTRHSSDTSVTTDGCSRAIPLSRISADSSTSSDVAFIPTSSTIWLPLGLVLNPAMTSMTMKGKTLTFVMKAEPTALVLDPATTEVVISG